MVNGDLRPVGGLEVVQKRTSKTPNATKKVKKY
jgi:hypothetical protein